MEKYNTTHSDMAYQMIPEFFKDREPHSTKGFQQYMNDFFADEYKPTYIAGALKRAITNGVLVRTNRGCYQLNASLEYTSAALEPMQQVSSILKHTLETWEIRVNILGLSKQEMEIINQLLALREQVSDLAKTVEGLLEEPFRP